MIHVQVARYRKGNPEMPAWMKADYEGAWTQASALALADIDSKIDSPTTRAILGVLDLVKGELKLCAMLSGLDEAEVDEWLEE